MSGEPKAGGSVVAGATWMIAARFAERLLGLCSTIVLARFLAPSDFGLVAMAMVFVAAADLLGAFGLDWALVRQRDLQTRHLNTAWTIRVILGLASFGALALIALPAADFYAEPRIAPMIIVLGLSLLVAAFENPGVVMFRREMNFTKEFQLRTAAKFFGAVVAVSVAVAFRSYWALLLGTLGGRAVSTLMSYAVHAHRPRFSLSARKELMSFSIWLWLSNILTFLRTRVVELLLGRLAGSRSLGLFTVAGELAQLASTELAAPIHRVLYSAYAAKGNVPASVGSVYLIAASAILTIALPVIAVTYLAAPHIIMLVLGPQWNDAVPVLQRLAIAGAFGIFSVGTVHVYWAINKARLETFVEVFWVLCLVTLAVALTPSRGVIGAADAVLISSAVVAPLNILLLRQYAGVSLRATLNRNWRTVGACLLMTGLVTQFIPVAPAASSAEAAMRIVTITVGGGAVYVATLLGLWWLIGKPNGPERDVLSLVQARLRGSPL